MQGGFAYAHIRALTNQGWGRDSIVLLFFVYCGDGDPNRIGVAIGRLGAALVVERVSGEPFNRDYTTPSASIVGENESSKLANGAIA